MPDAARPMHRYEPYRARLPPLAPYTRSLWKRREFAVELSRTNLRAQHFNTSLGQLWLVANPLLLGLVYFVLVDLLTPARPSGFFAHLLAGLFLFSFVQQSAQHGATSVVAGGRLILNSAFPRALLPLAAVRTAVMRFLPTAAVYVPVHIASGLSIGAHLLWAVAVLALLMLFVSGLSLLLAVSQVYFRDIKSFLPYLLRLWLYVTPVLYYAEDVPDRYAGLLELNPLHPFFVAWSDTLGAGRAPSASALLAAAAWAAGMVVAGGLVFLSRERDFAVRV